MDNNTIETTPTVSWELLVDLEPRLELLLDDVKDARPEHRRGFNYQRCWGRFKNRISDLVGWHRSTGDPRLRTTQAYETAYRVLCDALYD
jgi:hypothetical protein